MSTQDTDGNEIRDIVKQKYGEAARVAMQVKGASCCGLASCCAPGGKDVITSDLYSADEAAALPETAVLASLGCGNPTALAELSPGEVVLDDLDGGTCGSGVIAALSPEERTRLDGKIMGAFIRARKPARGGS